jgi:hypothetical protein
MGISETETEERGIPRHPLSKFGDTFGKAKQNRQPIGEAGEFWWFRNWHLSGEEPRYLDELTDNGWREEEIWSFNRQ